LRSTIGIAAHLSADQWMACGVGAWQWLCDAGKKGGFVRVCADGPIFEAQEIEWEI